MHTRTRTRKFLVAVASGVGGTLAVGACSSYSLPGAPVVIGDVATCVDGSPSCHDSDIGPVGVAPEPIDGGDASSDGGDAATDSGDASKAQDAADKG